ncbi:MAG: type II toxin-antitoxin system VapC family toxin [Chloroflexota bacterium]
MSYLIDTDAVADWLNSRPEAVRLLPTLQLEGIAISLITYGEVYDGIYYGRDPRAAEQAFLRFLRGVAVLPPNRSIMRRFALLRGDLRRRGLGIGDLDTMIAATALHYDLTLVTRNLRHYTRIPGLKIL